MVIIEDSLIDLRCTLGAVFMKQKKGYMLYLYNNRLHFEFTPKIEYRAETRTAILEALAKYIQAWKDNPDLKVMTFKDEDAFFTFLLEGQERRGD